MSDILFTGVPLAATKTRQIPLGNYPNGTRNFGPIATPKGLDQFDIRIGRCTTADPTIWPNASTVLKIDLQFSFDGGVNYTPLGANSWEQGGGIIVQRGVEQAETILTWSFSPDQPTHFKGRITVTGGPIRTYLDATILT